MYSTQLQLTILLHYHVLAGTTVPGIWASRTSEIHVNYKLYFEERNTGV